MPVNNFKRGTAKYRMQTFKSSFHMSNETYSMSVTVSMDITEHIFPFWGAGGWGFILSCIYSNAHICPVRTTCRQPTCPQPHPTFPVTLSGHWSHHRMLFLGFVWVSKNTEQIHELRSPPSHPMDLAMMSSDRKIVSCKRLCF